MVSLQGQAQHKCSEDTALKAHNDNWTFSDEPEALLGDTDEEDNDDLGEVMRMSQEEFEKAETLRKMNEEELRRKEEEDFQKAIKESLKAHGSANNNSVGLTSSFTNGAFSSSAIPESSGLVSHLILQIWLQS